MTSDVSYQSSLGLARGLAGSLPLLEDPVALEGEDVLGGADATAGELGAEGGREEPREPGEAVNLRPSNPAKISFVKAATRSALAVPGEGCAGLRAPEVIGLAAAGAAGLNKAGSLAKGVVGGATLASSSTILVSNRRICSSSVCFNCSTC